MPSRRKWSDSPMSLIVGMMPRRCEALGGGGGCHGRSVVRRVVGVTCLVGFQVGV